MSSEQISCVLWYRFRSIVTLSILWSLWISESAEEGQCLDKQIFSMTSVLGWGQEHMLISESEDSKGSLETLKVPTLSQTAWELRSKHSGIQNNISSFRNDSEACGSLWPATEKKKWECLYQKVKWRFFPPLKPLPLSMAEGLSPTLSNKSRFTKKYKQTNKRRQRSEIQKKNMKIIPCLHTWLCSLSQKHPLWRHILPHQADLLRPRQYRHQDPCPRVSDSVVNSHWKVYSPGSRRKYCFNNKFKCKFGYLVGNITLCLWNKV